MKQDPSVASKKRSTGYAQYGQCFQPVWPFLAPIQQSQANFILLCYTLSGFFINNDTIIGQLTSPPLFFFIEAALRSFCCTAIVFLSKSLVHCSVHFFDFCPVVEALLDLSTGTSSFFPVLCGSTPYRNLTFTRQGQQKRSIVLFSEAPDPLH